MSHSPTYPPNPTANQGSTRQDGNRVRNRRVNRLPRLALLVGTTLLVILDGILLQVSRFERVNHAKPPTSAPSNQETDSSEPRSGDISWNDVTVYPRGAHWVAPAVSRNNLVKVETALITDMEHVDWLEHPTKKERLVLRSVYLSLRISNLSDFPLVVEDIEVVPTGMIAKHVPFESFDPPLRLWTENGAYTGAAEMWYKTFNVSLYPGDNKSISRPRSVFAAPQEGDESLSKHRSFVKGRPFYRIPPNDTDMVGIAFDVPHSQGYEGYARFIFHVRCVIRGNRFTVDYRCPYGLILIDEVRLNHLISGSDTPVMDHRSAAK